MSYLTTGFVAFVAGAAVVHYWPCIKQWFSDESTAIATAVRAHI